MTSRLTRRSFLRSIAASAAVSGGLPNFGRPPARLFFTSQGKTGLMNADGSGLRYLDVKAPNQVTWQPGPFFRDGRRVILLSMEQRRDGPGRPFDEYYTQTTTHIWIYDVESGALQEIATKERLAVFYTPALLIGDDRILVQVVRNRVGQIFNMKLDGTDAREFTKAGEGLPYGLSLSPDRKRVAYHLASPRGYEIWTSDVEGGNRACVASHPDHLYFGPKWSPDGKWLLYQDCLYRQDPGHDWADVRVAAVDGMERRSVTEGQSCWFGATYGNPKNRGGGSNMPVWTRDSRILVSRRLPGSKVPWEFQAQRPDTDHFNRDFKPELAKGGTEICLIDPRNGAVQRLTKCEPPVWDFRASQSPDGKHIAFCRAKTGEPPAIWVMDSDGRNQRLLTRGVDDLGADHPVWLGNA